MKNFTDRLLNQYIYDLRWDSIEQLNEWLATYANKSLNLGYSIAVCNSLVEIVYLRNDKSEPCRQIWYNIVKENNYYKLIKR